MNRWLTTDEVGRRLGVTSQTVRRLIHERKLRARVLTSQSRPIYRVSERALGEFQARYHLDTFEDDWE